MTFNPNEPVASDALSVSQPKLLVNYQQINTVFGVDHVKFDDSSSDKGKHNQATFIEQADDPTTIGDEYAVYAKDDSGDSELYAKPESNGASYQLTKDGNLFVRSIPEVAVNFDNTATAIPGLGAVNGTAINVASIAQPVAGRFVIGFTTPLPDNNYIWDVSGFAASGGAVIASVTNDSNYGDVVKTDEISIDFRTTAGVLVTNLTRAVLIIRRVQ